MPTVTTRLNDVEIDRVASLARKIQEQPEVADTRWAAEVTWTGGFRSESRIRGFDPSRSDEPGQLGGTDTGPNPVEQLLGALGNCLAVGYAANATMLGIEINAMKISVEGDLNLQTFLGLNNEHAGFSRISASVEIKSEASPEDLKALHAKVTQSSPVGHTLSRAVPIEIDLV